MTENAGSNNLHNGDAIDRKIAVSIQGKTFERARKFAEKALSSRRFALVIFIASILSGLLTFIALSGTAGTTDSSVEGLLYTDLVLMLLLAVIVIQRVVGMWVERRQGRAGSALHVRLVMMFSLLAVTPAIMVSVFAALFMNFGVHAWFSDRVKTAIESSSIVANAYLQEHLENIRADTFAMASDINRSAANLIGNEQAFNQFLSNLAAIRSLPEAIVVDASGRIMARSRFSMSIEFDLVPQEVLGKARNGEIAILTTPQDDRVRAIIKLDRFADTYLLVGRFIDSQVLEHMSTNSNAVQLYKSLEEKSGSIQITFVAIFTVVAILILLAAVWIGMAIANQLVRPISGLISAAQKVSAGSLDVYVDMDTETDMGELSSLITAFNEMTSQLRLQQDGLIKINRQMDERRRFTETVLSGVSAGVIGLDSMGRINLPNKSASMLLGLNLSDEIGKKLSEVVPEMLPLIMQAMDKSKHESAGEISLLVNAKSRILFVNVAEESLNNETIGYVVTFDDITELQSAQRKAAWSGVARRIAHEIKNPLTPIQLAAERLQRRYLDQITDDPETFKTCTDTIIRQVEDLGRMVDEFSSFARMPQAILKIENISELCRQSVFLEKNRNPDISFEQRLPDNDVSLNCDARQVSRALTNLLKNAAESVSESMNIDKDVKGKVKITLTHDEGVALKIIVEDNGKGLPAENTDQLMEPYVTTREKGTGLGLAIVRKIMEDHNGELILKNRKSGGAIISLIFPLNTNSNITTTEVGHGA
ncbi:MAG: PAS domain-containing sensor histidine kinase [Rhodospirillaceae bacterium]|nr:PAS domain-containing sensor histidine kinase [Rhodospirillaceae bacterium]